MLATNALVEREPLYRVAKIRVDLILSVDPPLSFRDHNFYFVKGRELGSSMMTRNRNPEESRRVLAGFYRFSNALGAISLDRQGTERANVLTAAMEKARCYGDTQRSRKMQSFRRVQI